MNTLPETIDAIDHLIGATTEDRKVMAALTHCRIVLAGISWERFRLRHEEKSRRARVARAHAAFVYRHKRQRISQ